MRMINNTFLDGLQKLVLRSTTTIDEITNFVKDSIQPRVETTYDGVTPTYQKLRLLNTLHGYIKSGILSGNDLNISFDEVGIIVKEIVGKVLTYVRVTDVSAIINGAVNLHKAIHVDKTINIVEVRVDSGLDTIVESYSIPDVGVFSTLGDVLNAIKKDIVKSVCGALSDGSSDYIENSYGFHFKQEDIITHPCLIRYGEDNVVVRKKAGINDDDDSTDFNGICYETVKADKAMLCYMVDNVSSLVYKMKYDVVGNQWLVEKVLTSTEFGAIYGDVGSPSYEGYLYTYFLYTIGLAETDDKDAYISKLERELRIANSEIYMLERGRSDSYYSRIRSVR